MNQLIKKEKDFLRLLLSTSIKQKQALIKTVGDSQLKAIVQIVYNVLIGNRYLSEKDKKELSRHKNVIRRFVKKRISQSERKQILYKYIRYILKYLSVVRSELQ